MLESYKCKNGLNTASILKKVRKIFGLDESDQKRKTYRIHRWRLSSQMGKANIPRQIIKPSRIVQPYSWIGHIPFAMWIVEQLKPRVFVELGTHSGNSYFAVCQTVKHFKLGTKCFAVDSWKGDPQAGFYDDSIYNEVSAYNEKTYSHFSLLKHMLFNEALNDFPDRTIDLLHMDGCHTYEAVNNDFQNWLPKMSDKGIILIHDIAEKDRDFGVQKFWEKIVEEYHHFSFVHSSGLGVLGVGNGPFPASICELFEAEHVATKRESIRDFYSTLSNILCVPEDRSVDRYPVDNKQIETAQIFINTGSGFNEQESFSFNISNSGRFEYNLLDLSTKKICEIRLDPAKSPCIFRISSGFIRYRKGDIQDIEKIAGNFIKGLDTVGIFIFDSYDPQLFFPLKYENPVSISLDYEVLGKDYELSYYLLNRLKKDIGHKEQLLSQSLSHLKDKSLYILQLEEQLGEQQRILKDKETLLKNKDNLLEQKDQLLKSKDNQLLEKDQLLKSKDNQLLEKDQLLKSKDNQLLEKDQLLKSKDNQLLEKDQILNLKDSQIRNKDATITEIQNLSEQYIIQMMYHERKKLEKAFKRRTPFRIIRRCLGTFRHSKYSIKYFFEKMTIKKTGLFDEKYYLDKNQDLILTNIDLLRHFILHGWREGRNPANDFDVEFYLNHNPDVRKSGMNPLYHYLKKGAKEGRAKNQIEYAAKQIRESGLFDEEFYLEKNHDIKESGIDPLVHYLSYGWKEDRNPNRNFDTTSYLEKHPEIKIKNLDPLSHYLANRTLEGKENQKTLIDWRQPQEKLTNIVTPETSPLRLIKYRLFLGRLFDRKFYKENNEELYDTKTGVFRHFLKHGWSEHKDPSSRFSFSYYLKSYPDVANLGIDPLLHYIKYGRKEGRLPSVSSLKPSRVSKVKKRIIELNNRFRSSKYEYWLRLNTPSKSNLDFQRTYQFLYSPLISIVVPVYNPPLRFFNEMVESVKAQTYSNWELCISDSSTNRKLQRRIEKTASSDSRIKYIKHNLRKGISENSNTALTLCTGEYVGLLDQDDLLTPDALFEVVNRLNVNKEIDIIYTDEDKISVNSKKCFQPHFKPDWSPDTFMSIMYTCHFTLYRKSLIEQTGGFRPEYDGAQDYDLMLRASEITKHIVHIPRILYHWRASETSIAKEIGMKNYAVLAVKKAKIHAIDRRQLRAKLREIKDFPGQFCIDYLIYGNPPVSIIISTRDKSELLKQCIDSIINKTLYSNYEIIVVDNNSQKPQTLQYFNQLEKFGNVKIVPFPIDFNFSTINNYAVSKSSGEYLLFLNNDTEVIHHNWLSKMLGFAQLEHIGAVGAQLLYQDRNTIQHCGIISLYEGPGHAFINTSQHKIQYFGRNRVDYNWVAVTAACMMINREKFNLMDGFDKDLPIAYNDVDLCFRLVKHGYYNICANSVQLIHHESATREIDHLNHEKRLRLEKERELLYRKNPEFIHYDPFFNRNFNQHRVDFALKD